MAVKRSKQHENRNALNCAVVTAVRPQCTNFLFELLANAAAKPDHVITSHPKRLDITTWKRSFSQQQSQVSSSIRPPAARETGSKMPTCSRRPRMPNSPTFSLWSINLFYRAVEITQTSFAPDVKMQKCNSRPGVVVVQYPGEKSNNNNGPPRSLAKGVCRRGLGP